MRKHIEILIMIYNFPFTNPHSQQKRLPTDINNFPRNLLCFFFISERKWRDWERKHIVICKRLWNRDGNQTGSTDSHCSHHRLFVNNDRVRKLKTFFSFYCFCGSSLKIKVMKDLNCLIIKRIHRQIHWKIIGKCIKIIEKLQKLLVNVSLLFV